jgi:hypothetical protein
LGDRIVALKGEYRASGKAIAYIVILLFSGGYFLLASLVFSEPENLVLTAILLSVMVVHQIFLEKPIYRYALVLSFWQILAMLLLSAFLAFDSGETIPKNIVFWIVPLVFFYCSFSIINRHKDDLQKT